MTQSLELGAINRLRQAGLRPPQASWDAVLQLGTAAIPSLLDLALDTALLKGSEPAAYAPIHALRLLGQLPAGEHAERVLREAEHVDETAGEASFVWYSDLPQIVASWGAAAMPGIRNVWDDAAAVSVVRSAAAEAMSYAVAVEPALRAEVIESLRRQLATEPDASVGGNIVAALANLRAAEAYSEVMAAFRRGAVDREIMNAGTARQLLLGQQENTRLACVHHSLAERYDQHGPFTPEQRRVLAESYRQNLGGY